MECTAKVFLLTGEWTDQEGQVILTYYGRSPKLGPVEIIIDNFKCSFMIPKSAELPELNCKYLRKNSDLLNFSGDPVDILIFASYNESRSAADRLRNAGIPTFESDVKPHERFLMENFINGQVAIQGPSIVKGNMTTFVNPLIKPCEVNTNFRVASIDIECGVASERLYSIACDITGAGVNKEICFMLGDKRENRTGNLEIYPTEQGVLNAFMEWFREEDPDIIIGWHVIGFDLMYLEKKCESFYMDLNISRNGKKPFFHAPQSGGYYATISGRVVLDGPHCMRDAGYTFENYSLETVSQALLGEGKIITSSKENKIAEIEDFFENDKDMLAKYNIQDCALVTRIYDHVNMIDFMTSRVKCSGLLLPSIGIPSASFDHTYLPRLHRLGFCAPALTDSGRPSGNENLHINQYPGIYENVCIFDIQLLVEAIIGSFHIDPLGRICSNQDKSTSTPGLMNFSAERNILPHHFEVLREAALDDPSPFTKAVAITSKMLIDSLKSNNNRFYNYDNIAALDDCIRWVLTSCKKFLESEGYALCASSPHRLYIQMKPQESGSPLEHADLLAERLASHLKTLAQNEFDVNFELELFCNEHYKKMVIPANTAFSRESVTDIRFAGLTSEKTVLTGLKTSGSDWTELTNSFQIAMYENEFANNSLEEWMKSYVEKLKTGEFDDQLVYSRKLTKKVEEYSGSLPPHVKAAKLLQKPGKVINYYMTSRGPVPVELKPQDIDYQHYLDRQLGPIADSLLNLRNMHFENLFKAQQLSLFDF